MGVERIARERCDRKRNQLEVLLSSAGRYHHLLEASDLIEMCIRDRINAWDGGGTSYGRLVQVGKSLHLYYYGYKDAASPYEPGRGIGLAVSDSGDLQKFRKVRA